MSYLDDDSNDLTVSITPAGLEYLRANEDLLERLLQKDPRELAELFAAQDRINEGAIDEM